MATKTAAIAGAVMLAVCFVSCSRTERRRADLLAKDFRSYESAEFNRELAGAVAKLTAKVESLPSDAHKDLALSCTRHTQAMFSAMRARNQKEAANQALTGYVASCQLFAEGLRASIDSIGQGQAGEAESHMAAAKLAGRLGQLFYKVLTPLALYSPAGDRMSIFQSMARVYPTVPKDTAQQTLAALMQGVYGEEDRPSNKSRMGQLLKQAGIPPTASK